VKREYLRRFLTNLFTIIFRGQILCNNWRACTCAYFGALRLYARNNGHFQKSTEEVDRSYFETWLIVENNARRTNAKEEGLWNTKDNVLDWSRKTRKLLLDMKN